jgi:hypothetical protein
LQPLHDVDLLGGEDLGDYLLDPYLGRDRRRDGHVVASEEYGSQSHVPQRLHRGGARRFDGVRDGQERPGLGIPADQHGGVALRLSVCLGGQQFSRDREAAVRE